MNNLNCIVAASTNRVIGNENKLLWHYKEDMKFFKEKTYGHAVIMGKNTYLSIGKPLQNRINIILTHDEAFSQKGTIVVHNKQDALEEAYVVDKEPFIIGGESVYSLFKDEITKIYYTLINKEYQGDAYFINLDLVNKWDRVKKEQSINPDTPELWFMEFNRKALNK